MEKKEILQLLEICTKKQIELLTSEMSNKELFINIEELMCKCLQLMIDGYEHYSVDPDPLDKLFFKLSEQERTILLEF
jgi:hypothetical protein